MRNFIILFGIIFLTVFSCKAQEKETFKIEAGWQKGEEKEMIVQHSGSCNVGGQVDSFPSTNSVKYHISIVDKTEQGYIVEWKIVNDDKELKENEFMKEYISQFKYVIETDINGKFKELSNWKSLISLNKELKDKVTKEARKEKVSQSEIDTMIASMNIPETKDDLITTCKGLTDIFHEFYGEEFTINDTVFKPTIISNEYITEGIPATLETTSRKIDNEKICVRYSYVYNDEQLKELQEKYFPYQEYTESTINTFSEFIYNIKTGWIEKITVYNEYRNAEIENLIILEYIIK